MRLKAIGKLTAYGASIVLSFLALSLIWLIRGPAPMVLALAAVIVAARTGGLGPGLLATALVVAGTGAWSFSGNGPEPAPGAARALSGLSLLAAEGVLFSLLVDRLGRLRTQAETSAREARDLQDTANEAREQLQMVLDHMPAAVFMKDLDGRYLRVNPGFVASAGLSAADQMEGLSDEEIWPAETTLRFRDQDRQVVRSGPRQFEDRVLVGGQERVFLTTKFPMPGREGRPTLVCGLSLDLTEQFRMEEKIRQATASAETANRAKDRFLAVLSHELRTPLTPALVAISGLLDGTIRDDPRPTLEMVRRNIELEAHLVDDLLDISRIASGGMRLDPVVLDAHEVLRQGLEFCRAETERAGLQVELDLRAVRPFVRADRSRLLQLFWNLVHSAVKFSPDGGRLLVSSRSDPGEGPEDPPERLVLEFADSGLGLSPEGLERIFEPFEQAWPAGKSRQGGLGLGLAISQAVAEAHGGRLSASSPGLNLGTRFVLELPLAEGADVPSPRTAQTQSEAEPETASDAPPGPLRILLVEDNADTLRYLDLVLSRMGHQVYPAATVSAALEIASEHVFDLLLSDIELPDGTGLELMRALASTRDTPGIAMSGFGSEEDMDQSLSAGFSLHLTKPLDTSRLGQAIRWVARPPSQRRRAPSRG